MALHNVLIPIDGSNFARHVFEHVIKFLPPADNQIFLLRVGDPPEGHVGEPGRQIVAGTSLGMFDTPYELEPPKHTIYASQEEQTLESKMKVEMETDREQLEAAGYQVRTFVRFGDPGHAIVDFVTSHDIELIAITTHWRQGVSRLIFGSVAQYVAPHVTIPLLMVRGESDE